jgi:hypothetical protein
MLWEGVFHFILHMKSSVKQGVDTEGCGSKNWRGKQMLDHVGQFWNRIELSVFATRIDRPI